jgi:hypothetical protein
MSVIRIFPGAAIAACLLCAATGAAPPPGIGRPVTCDVVVYGGTPAGVMAAVAAARHGHSVALVEPGAHVGGVVSGGLVYTDIGKRETVGGLADEFLRRVVTHYRDTYGADSRQFAQCKQGIKYEPHVAERLFEQMLGEQPTITVVKRRRLHSVATQGERIASLTVEDRAGRRRLVTAEVPVGRAIGRDVTRDDTDAELSGRWAPYVPDAYTGPFARRDVVLRGRTMPARARFTTTLPRSGRYRVCLGMRPEAHQAAAAEVKIRHAGGLARLTVDQRRAETPFPFTVLGEYRFDASKETFLEIANGNAGGRVVVDAVRRAWVGE